ncbi:hypothetical protein N1851_032678 [Merluccius polli]|uniref:Uncharacterized protein n=1 Tax=Merluccius polli TaxID=89951 RepID=A0AA47M2L1_MERPO|nr:hypothetical protein N1851_032678 [Merluccius polli]
MDSKSVLGQHSQNKIHSDYLRLKNEENRIPGDPRSKSLAVPQFFKEDVENKNPGSTGKSQKASIRSGSSRLPVLAKSLNLQTSKEFAQSHKIWEDKPLAGKAKSKKPCTKPVPFNFSEPRSKGMAPQNQRLLRTLTPRVGSDENTLYSQNSRRNNMNAKTPTKTPSTKFGVDFASQRSTAQKLATRKPKSSIIPDVNVELTDRMETLQGTGPSNAVSLTSHTLKQMATAQATASQVSRQPDAKTIHQNTFAASAQALQSQESTEACLNNLDLLSIKDTAKKRTLQAAASASSLNSLGGKEEAFQLDHAALLSILRDEGVGAMRVGSATPESTKPYNYLRVTVMKSHQKAGPITGPMRVSQFVLDPAAMRSTLHGEGVKANGPLDKTPSNTGRGTSIYTARRVPVTKPRGETPGGPAVMPHEGTTTMKWTPGRVPNTRHQPMSAIASMHKRCLSARPMSNNLLACTSEPQPHDEGVVQRLFDDQDDEQTMNVSEAESETHTDQLSDQASGGIGRVHGAEVEQDEKSGGGQPFLQQPHRESVIFFSTGKKLFRAPRVEKPEGLIQSEKHGDALVSQRATEPGLDGKRPEFDPAGLRKHFAPSLQRDFLVHKSSAAASPAMALLLKRRLLLDELRLDEEVATYTCCSVPEAQPFQPPRPRCGNPLASFLHFQDSTLVPYLS